MKKFAIISIVLAFATLSCSKNKQVIVTYQATGSVSQYNLNYTVQNGVLKETHVVPQSGQDKWVFSFAGEEGDVVYLSGKYGDINSGLNLVIKFDGKIYKQVSGEGDTLKYLIVSGVVPYK